jgi:sugar phosphate isomerase/epimerase
MSPAFGLSTFLCYRERLDERHVAAIARAGFDALELFALRTHFDYRDPAACDALARALDGHDVALHSVHAPTALGWRAGEWDTTLSIAAADAARRTAALDEAVAALDLAARIPFRYLVLHVGVPDAFAGPGDNSPAAAKKSLGQLFERAEALGVTLALELVPNALSTAERLQRLVDDEDPDLGPTGVCLDVGHGHLMGDLVDAIETASGLIVTTHVHDNDGRHDAHLVPFDGTIPWAEAAFALQKVGYEGRLVFELGPTAAFEDVLTRAAAARARLSALFEDTQL